MTFVDNIALIELKSRLPYEPEISVSGELVDIYEAKNIAEKLNCNCYLDRQENKFCFTYLFVPMATIEAERNLARWENKYYPYREIYSRQTTQE